jgi:lipoprotein
MKILIKIIKLSIYLLSIFLLLSCNDSKEKYQKKNILEFPVDIKIFDSIGYYFDAENNNILVCFSTISSYISFSDVRISNSRQDEKLIFFSIFGTMENFDMKNSEFKICSNGDYLISFSVAGFNPMTYSLIYVDSYSHEKQIKYLGNATERELIEKK